MPRNCSVCSHSLVLCRVSGPPARRGRSTSPSRIRHKSSLSRSKSRSRSRSPRSPSRHGGRYKCEPPKFPPYTRHRTIPDLSKRYVDLYIPPEFCRTGAGWLDSLPDHKALNLVQPIDLQINKVGMHKVGIHLHQCAQLLCMLGYDTPYMNCMSAIAFLVMKNATADSYVYNSHVQHALLTCRFG